MHSLRHHHAHHRTHRRYRCHRTHPQTPTRVGPTARDPLTRRPRSALAQRRDHSPHLSSATGYRLNRCPRIAFGRAMTGSPTSNRVTRQSGQLGCKFMPRRPQLHRAPAYSASASGFRTRFPFPGPQRRDRISYPSD